MKAAFFKGTKAGLSALFDIGVHEWEEGDYAHVELVLSDGRSLSSTFLDGGVRFTVPGSIDFADTTQWDVLDLGSAFDEAVAIGWGNAHKDDKYDSWGDAHFVCGLLHHKPNEEFCSEAVGLALGFDDAWRLDPNALCVAVKRVLRAVQARAA